MFFVLNIYGNVNAQSFEWAHQTGSSASVGELGTGIGSDKFGNIYYTGNFSGTADFDPSPSIFNISSVGLSDIFLIKVDSAGNFIWAKTIGGSMTDLGGEIAVDSMGNIYLTATFEGTIDADPNAGVFNLISHGGFDVIIAKYNSSGSMVWAKCVGGLGLEQGQTITLSVYDEVSFSGIFDGNVDVDLGFDTVYLSSVLGSTDIFVINVNATGDFLWAKQIGGNGIDDRVSIGSGSAGQIYITGNFEIGFDFDPGPVLDSLACPGPRDIFILRLDSAGNFIWVKQITGTYDKYVEAINVDAFDNILITGQFYGTCDFNTSGVYNLTISPTSVYEPFISKYDSNGNMVFAYQITATSGFNRGIGTVISSDVAGNVYAAGHTRGVADLDPGPGIFTVSSGSAYYGYLIILDNFGNYISSSSFTTPGKVFQYGLEIFPYGDIYSTGTFAGTNTDFDPGLGVFPFTDIGSDDIFLYKLKHDICSDFYLIIDSINNVECLNSGFVSLQIIGSHGSCGFEWNGNSAVTDSFAYFNLPGLYDIIVTDSIGCVSSRKFIVSGVDTTGMIFIDMDVNLIAGVLRQGLNSNIWLDGFNHGCDSISGTLTIVMDTMVHFDSASVIPDFILGDTLIWNFSNLVYDSPHLIPQIFITVDSSAIIGDTACFEVFINPTFGDIDSTNNYKNYCFPIKSGYDPNVKSVYPLGECLPKYILNNQKLTYTIQFQNTGTADAINIYVLDTLDSNLDLTSVRVIGQSDYVITEVLPGNVLKFRFDNIYLPDSTSDEPNSHGYVIYEVGPLPAILNGTIIENTASIFFDFNPGVNTNMVSNTIIDILPSCYLGFHENISKMNNILVYPNPTNNSITISTSNSIANKIELKDVYGRTIKTVQPNSSQTSMDLQNVASGIYFVTVWNGSSQQTVKVVKQ